MLEVKAKRFLGPYKLEELPLQYFYQSPQGLIPKKGSTKLRNIFHLSYPRDGVSVNSGIDKNLCSVKYRDIDYVIQQALKQGANCYFSSSDFSQAFRHLPLAKKCWPYLVLMAVNPLDQEQYYFVEKNLPFGLAIAPKIFQDFSNAIAFLVGAITNDEEPANYIDDFLNTKLDKNQCNYSLQVFIDICQYINFPVSDEKTIYATQIIVFLGLLLNSRNQTISIPGEKRDRALTLINQVLSSSKITVLTLQSLTGLLNFVGRAVVPGKAFTRRLYAKAPAKLKQYHHISVDKEMRKDLLVWKEFLKLDSSICRPFIDLNKTLIAIQLQFFTDSSTSTGCGGYYKGEYFSELWPNWVKTQKISINFLELYALVCGVLVWLDRLHNKRIKVFCDNQSVVCMVNNNSSSCKQCMILIRTLVLASIQANCRIFAEWIPTKQNTLADALSRNDMQTFRNHAPKNLKLVKRELPNCMWPIPKSWWN